MINEFDISGKRTENHKKFKEVIENLDIAALIRDAKAVRTSLTNVKQLPEEAAAVLKILEPMCQQLKTDSKCPKCRHELYLSDLPQYDFVCLNCDENF